MFTRAWDLYYRCISGLISRWHAKTVANGDKMQKNIRLGRRWFGNDALFSYNLMGRINMAWSRRCSGHRRKTNPNNPAAQQLHRDGYAILPGTAPAEVLEEVGDEYQRMINHEDHSFERISYSRMIYRPQHLIPAIGQLITPEIKAAIEDYYGSYFQVLYVCFYRTEHIPPAVAAVKEAYSNHWHCDRMPSDLVTITSTLSDVTADDGPFLIQSREATRRLIKMGFRDRSNYGLPVDVVEDPRNVVKLVGPRGTTMLSDNQCCLHRASIPGPGRCRDIASFQVSASRVPLSKNWLEEIQLCVPEQMHLARLQKRAETAAAA